MLTFFAKHINKIAAVLLLCLAGSAVIALYSFQEEFHRQSKEFRDNLVYYTSQIERDVITTNLKLKEVQQKVASNTLTNKDQYEFSNQFDILWSRVFTLDHGSIGHETMLLENAQSNKLKLEASLKKMDEFVSSQSFSKSSLEIMDAELKEMAKLSRELLLSSVTANVEKALIRQENLNRTYITTIVFIVLSIAVGIVVFILLIKQNSHLKELRVSLEKKVEHRTNDLLLRNKHLRREIEQRERITSELRLSQAQAEEANRAKTHFLANMSHELRTPLNAIIGFAEVIKQEIWGPINQPKYAEYISDIHNSGQHLSNLLKEILDLTKIEAGESAASYEEITLSEIIEDVSRLVKVLQDRNKGQLHINIDPSLKLNVDPTMIKQIILNFVSNAFKHGGQNCEVNVSVSLGEDLKILVADNGRGIPKEECENILEPFQQARQSALLAAATDKATGTGIGLSISKRLAELHDGEIIIESELGEGTTSILSLPLSVIVKESA